MTKHFYRYLLLLSIFVSGCKDSEVAPHQSLTLEEEQLLLGYPSGATADVNKPNNYLITTRKTPSLTATGGARPTGRVGM